MGGDDLGRREKVTKIWATIINTSLVGRCGVVGSTLAFESDIFISYCISLEQAEITGIVLTGRFSLLPAVFHSVSYLYGEGESSSSVPVVVLRG